MNTYFAEITYYLKGHRLVRVYSDSQEEAQAKLEEGLSNPDSLMGENIQDFLSVAHSMDWETEGVEGVLSRRYPPIIQKEVEDENL